MPIIVQGLPEKPHLPNPPTTQDQVFLWSGALNRALYDILSQIARKVNSRTFDGNVDFGGFNLTNIGTITATTGLFTNVSIGTLLTLTGGQIAFPATQVPSAGANVLDDYEEGSWTPLITFGGAAVGLTYTVQVGRYIKIGRLVRVQWDVQINALGASTGVARMTNFPFSSDNTAGVYGVVTHALWSTLVSAVIPIGYIAPGTTASDLLNGNAATGVTALTHANFAASSRLIGQGIYMAAA